MRATFVALAVVTGAVVAGSYVLAGDDAPAPLRTPAPDIAPLEPIAGTGDPAEVDRLIAAFETTAAASPDPVQLTFLGRLHLLRARIVGDAASLERAVAVLGDAVRRAPADHEAGVLLAAARHATHDFTGALAAATAVGLDDPGARAAAADAHLELGRYDLAGAVYDELAEERPGDPAVLLRRGRLAFLRGDGDVAASLADDAYELALDAGVFGVQLAQYDVLRSTLAFERGDYRAARAAARRAQEAQPGWHVALGAEARATAALGRLAAAARLYSSAIEAAPEPGHVAGLAGVLAAQGDAAGAAEQLALLDVVARLGATDRVVAQAWLDHGVRTDEALFLATAELGRRSDVHGHDLHAWALLAAGRPLEARAASDRALALGTPDARLLYHAGLISLALGDAERAAGELRAALDLSPAFDPVHAPRAAATLRLLEAAP